MSLRAVVAARIFIYLDFDYLARLVETCLMETTWLGSCRISSHEPSGIPVDLDVLKCPRIERCICFIARHNDFSRNKLVSA